MNNLATTNHPVQPVAPRPDFEKLAKRFAAPVPVLATGGRRLEGKDSKGLLGALLREVHETILSRRFEVVTDSGLSLGLYVADRRLIRIELADGTSNPPRSSPHDMADYLAGYLAGATGVTLHHVRTDSAVQGGEAGCTALALASALSIDLLGLSFPDPVPRFFDALSPGFAAWAVLDRFGRARKQGGDGEWARRIVNLTFDGLVEIDAQLVQSLASPEHPGCIMLNFGEDDSNLLVYARSARAGFVAVLDAGAISAAREAWKAALAGNG